MTWTDRRKKFSRAILDTLCDSNRYFVGPQLCGECLFWEYYATDANLPTLQKYAWPAYMAHTISVPGDATVDLWQVPPSKHTPSYQHSCYHRSIHSVASHSGYCPPIGTTLTSQALPPAIRSQWQHVAEARRWLDPPGVQDIILARDQTNMDVALFLSLCAETPSTKCAICRFSLTPECCHLLPLSDFNVFRTRLSNRRNKGPTLAHRWQFPSSFGLGFSVYTRAAMGQYGPSFVVCNECYDHPNRGHFSSPVLPADVLPKDGCLPFAPPTAADLGHMHPVRCHDRHVVAPSFCTKYPTQYCTPYTVLHPPMAS